MKKLIISGVFCSVLMLGGFQVASAEETTTTTTSNTEMLAKIQDLMKLITDLQAKLAQIRGEVQELTRDLALGAKDDDVKKIQQLLASDPSLFGVEPTGYFGPITEAAIKKFQERYGLPVTGIVDEATREVMKELRKERVNGDVPSGLVKSEEVKDRIRARLQAKWGDCVWGEKFRASDCLKGKDKDKDKDHDDDDDNASSTRAEALTAIEDANVALATFADEIDEMEEDGVDEDEIEDAKDDLADARKKLADARRSLVKGEYGDAVEKAEDAIDIVDGDDEDDDEDDDDDDDDEDDEDEDDDEEDED